jgi:hypothetical protein
MKSRSKPPTYLRNIEKGKRENKSWYQYIFSEFARESPARSLLRGDFSGKRCQSAGNNVDSHGISLLSECRHEVSASNQPALFFISLYEDLTG